MRASMAGLLLQVLQLNCCCGLFLQVLIGGAETESGRAAIATLK
jgi:hypothetical protein